jgi:hypothetical protein
MKLSLKRSQTRTLVLRRPVFKLWARFDLTSDEQRLMQRYPMDDAILTDGENDERVRTWANRAAITTTIAPVLWILLAHFDYISFFYYWYINTDPRLNYVSYFFENLPWQVLGILIVAATFVGTWYIIFHSFRDQVIITDMVHGRYFKAHSIVRLLEREDEINRLAVVFRRLLEIMKDWNGTQVVDIEPGAEPRLRVIENPDAAA